MQLFANYFVVTGVIGHTAWFLLNVSAKFEFGVFLSRNFMLVWCIALLCVHLCNVDVAYRRLSDWTRLQWALLWHMQQASPFSAMRGGDATLPR